MARKLSAINDSFIPNLRLRNIYLVREPLAKMFTASSQGNSHCSERNLTDCEFMQRTLNFAFGILRIRDAYEYHDEIKSVPYLSESNFSFIILSLD